MAMSVFECARVPEGTTCSVRIIGERDDVVQAAHDHLVSHGLTGGDELVTRVTRVVEEHHTTYGMWANAPRA
jgi:hypothetical protein